MCGGRRHPKVPTAERKEPAAVQGGGWDGQCAANAGGTSSQVPSTWSHPEGYDGMPRFPLNVTPQPASLETAFSGLHGLGNLRVQLTYMAMPSLEPHSGNSDPLPMRVHATAAEPQVPIALGDLGTSRFTHDRLSPLLNPLGTGTAGPRTHSTASSSRTSAMGGGSSVISALASSTSSAMPSLSDGRTSTISSGLSLGTNFSNAPGSSLATSASTQTLPAALTDRRTPSTLDARALNPAALNPETRPTSHDRKAASFSVGGASTIPSLLAHPASLAAPLLPRQPSNTTHWSTELDMYRALSTQSQDLSEMGPSSSHSVNSSSWSAVPPVPAPMQEAAAELVPQGCDPDAIKLFVGNIPKSLPESQLLMLLELVGKVAHLEIKRARFTHIAFVWYVTRQHAEQAILHFKAMRHVLPGLAEGQERPLVVRRAKPRPVKNPQQPRQDPTSLVAAFQGLDLAALEAQAMYAGGADFEGSFGWPESTTLGTPQAAAHAMSPQQPELFGMQAGRELERRSLSYDLQPSSHSIGGQGSGMLFGGARQLGVVGDVVSPEQPAEVVVPLSLQQRSNVSKHVQQMVSTVSGAQVVVVEGAADQEAHLLIRGTPSQMEAAKSMILSMVG